MAKGEVTSWFHLSEVLRAGKLVETESPRAGTGDWGRGWRLVFHGGRVSAGEDGAVLGTGGGDGAPQLCTSE